MGLCLDRSQKNAAVRLLPLRLHPVLTEFVFLHEGNDAAAVFRKLAFNMHGQFLCRGQNGRQANQGGKHAFGNQPITLVRDKRDLALAGIHDPGKLVNDGAI